MASEALKTGLLLDSLLLAYNYPGCERMGNVLQMWCFTFTSTFASFFSIQVSILKNVSNFATSDF